jgi:hypothetical protein
MPAHFHVSKLVRAAIKTQLAAQFNAELALAAADNGVDAFTIDFVNAGVSFFEANLQLQDLRFALEQWPSADKVCGVMALCVTASSDQKLSKPRTFSGAVQVEIRVFLRWPPANADSIAEADSHAELLADAIESAILYTTQRGEGSGAPIAWGAGITKAPGFTEQRSDMVLSPEDAAWYQQIDFTFQFQVSV